MLRYNFSKKKTMILMQIKNPRILNILFNSLISKGITIKKLYLVQRRTQSTHTLTQAIRDADMNLQR